MIVVLSGEGPSDFGCCTNGQGECQIPDFRYGPMTYFIDKEIEPLIGYSLLDLTPDRYIFVGKAPTLWPILFDHFEPQVRWLRWSSLKQGCHFFQDLFTPLL